MTLSSKELVAQLKSAEVPIKNEWGSSSMSGHDPHFTPRLMPAPAAAHYIGISESKLRSLGIPRRVMGGNRLYDRFDLDAYASSLPIEGEIEGEAQCDRLFGVSS